ncbi:flagellar biosynthesis repressor FlbT [Zavarzinia sp. CC-PAN008]|uniref:flagellar biosynthesis repressor FlbT n=1 Tax=Zavarzinia sp. CC-PAN008 TaxID=3243332 RepID=UPI003F746FD4
MEQAELTKVVLKPGERVLVNGTLIEMAEDGLKIDPRAVWLTDESILKPEEANSPARRVHLLVQAIYLDPTQYDEVYPQVVSAMGEIVRTTMLREVIDNMELVFQLLQDRRFDMALKASAALVAFETALLREYPSGASL